MSKLDPFLDIARLGAPFTADGGRTFITVRAQSLGFRTLPVRSRAFRQWFFDQCYSQLETIPPHPLGRSQSNRPVCDTKSPAIPATRSRQRPYPHKKYFPTFRRGDNLVRTKPEIPICPGERVACRRGAASLGCEPPSGGSR